MYIQVLEQDEEVEGHADPTLERTGKYVMYSDYVPRSLDRIPVRYLYTGAAEMHYICTFSI